ncbi:Alpha/Beta hydrolase protein [Xylariales sp. PMI_506]|nr:Alpha/Beta hydrolase protein [Xylariales sp. PMI_506]
MHWSVLTTGLLSVAALAESRSFQHVGRKSPRVVPEGENYYSHFLNTRQNTTSAAPQFLTANTTKFAVDGTAIPDVDWDVGESYAGRLSITDDPEGEDQFYFWFFPSTNALAKDEIIIWLNGGPGCSSLEGLLQENGPFLWQYGTFQPVPNPWSWNRLSNIVYIEQPIGTGFSTGTVTATNEEDIADQFNGFWKNFVDTFALQGYKIYITGESYAGAYCPYIASAMLDLNDTTYYNVNGMMIYDPVLGDDNVQTGVVTVPFVDYHTNLFPFQDSFVTKIHGLHESCGYADYMAKYLKYPPPGPQPALKTSAACEALYNEVYNQAFTVNPCFDVYQAATTCPLLWDVLGFPGSIFYIPDGATVYFNRTDVQEAINAPIMEWSTCSEGNVFKGFDRSDPSSWVVLPNVIDKTQNVIIGHGILDMVLIANGSLLTIQNMTWGGKLGFQEEPVEPFFVPYHALSLAAGIESEEDPTLLATMAAAGVMGTAHTERGLTFVTVEISGHMVPQYAPSAAFRQLEFLLGRVANLSSTAPFETEPNYPQPAASTLGKGTGPSLVDYTPV